MQTYNGQEDLSHTSAAEYPDQPRLAATIDYLPPVYLLPQYTSELEDYLKQHVFGIQSLLQGLRTESRDGQSDFGATKQRQEIQDHVAAIQRFLDQHASNVNTLRTTLSGTTPYSPPLSKLREGELHSCNCCATRSTHQNEPSHKECEGKETSSTYSTIVLMSTFTAGLIVSYLQLMYEIIPVPDENTPSKIKYHYHTGFRVGLISLVWNICVAIVASANTVIQGNRTRNRHRRAHHSPSRPEPCEVHVVVDDGSAHSAPMGTSKSGWSTTHIELTQLGGDHHQLMRKSPSGWRSTIRSVIKSYARRSVAFAFAQFIGAATFGISLGMLFYPLHSGDSLVFVPLFLLTIAIIIAICDLVVGVERNRRSKKLD